MLSGSQEKLKLGEEEIYCSIHTASTADGRIEMFMLMSEVQEFHQGDATERSNTLPIWVPHEKTHGPMHGHDTH